MAPPPATMVSRPPLIDHNSYISFRDFVPDEDAANLTRESDTPPSIDAGNPNTGKLWLGLEDQTAFIMAQREALEAFNVAKALRQSEESARADEARRARAAAAADGAPNTFATKVVVEEEDVKEVNGSCTQSQALAIRTMTPAPRAASRASASASAGADEAARSLARSQHIDAMQYSLLEKVSSGSLGSSYNPSTSASGYSYMPSSSPSTTYPISESPTRTRFTSASASAAAHAHELSKRAGASTPAPAPGSAAASASGIRRPSSSASTQAQAYARRPSLSTMASAPVVTAPPASAPIPVPNAYRSQTPASLSYQQSQYLRQQAYQQQQEAYQRSRRNSQSQPSAQNRPQSPPQPQQPYQQFIPSHARVASNSSIRSSTPLSSSFASSASAFASSSASSYPSRTATTPAPVASSSSSSPPKFNVPSQPPAGHSSASASAAGYTRARGLSRSETPSLRPNTPMTPAVAYAPSTSPTAYTSAAAMAGASEKRRKSSVSNTPQLAPSGHPPPSATPAPPSSLPRDGISIGARLARPSTSLGHGLLQHQRNPSQTEPPVPATTLPRSMTPLTHQGQSTHRDRQEAREAREARERQLAKEEAREAGADLFTPTRPCRGCTRPVASPRSQGSPDVDFPTPFADLLHVTCSACRVTHCRGCFTVARCPPGCMGGNGCLVVNCCPGVRAIAIFEALAAFDSVYISETTYFASVPSSSASQNAREGETSKKSHSSVGRAQRQVYLRALTARPRTGRFTSALMRTLKVLHDRLIPPAPVSSSSSDAGTAADTGPANLTPFIQRALACSLLPEVIHAFLVDAPVRDWVPHSELCCAMLDALSRVAAACPSIIAQRMRPIERSPGVGRVVWARGRLTWGSTSSSEQAAGGAPGAGSGEVLLQAVIVGLEPRSGQLRALAASMHYQETIEKLNALSDRMAYLSLQLLLGGNL